MNEDQNQLGTAPIGKLLFQMALPSVVAQLINMLYNIVDRIYIGHIPEVGALALTGVGVCMPHHHDRHPPLPPLWGAGGAPRASIFMGTGRITNPRKRSLGNCFTVQLIISVVLTAVLLHLEPGRCSWPSAPAKTPSAMPSSI